MSDIDVLEELQSMEGKYAFECGHCSEVFQTIIDIGLHSLERHPGLWLEIEPISKQ